MEEFTEEHVKHLLSKEWLCKIETGSATPYLMKYHCSQSDLSCCILVTDTKSVWAEALNSKQLARRWRACNPLSPEPFAKIGDEESWRENILDSLSNAHTMGGIAGFSFEITETNYSDRAFQLESEPFKWRWETMFLGPQRSSEIISKQLIFPLISLNHLAFSSSDVINDLPDSEIEKAVDKVARTARRTIDTHIKNALSKPRLATSIRRMTAMFNFTPDLLPVTSVAHKPVIHIEPIEEVKQVYEPPKEKKEKNREPSVRPEIFPNQERTLEAKKKNVASTSKPPSTREPSVVVPQDSATESDADDPMDGGTSKSAGPSEVSKTVTSPKVQPIPLVSRTVVSKNSPHPGSASSSPPAKKAKITTVQSSSDDDSDHECKKKAIGGAGAAVKRGTKQPVKRGGKRF